MRLIKANKITEAVSDLCVEAGLFLREDVLFSLRKAYARETNKRARKALWAIITNASVAAKEKLAICQDTGLPIVFLEIGQDVRVSGDLTSAVNSGIEAGYKKGFFRKSIIKDPVSRGKSGFTPAIIHTDIVKGNKLKITVYPRGFGCENKSVIRMFNPTAPLSAIREFIVETVRASGADACPPYIIGVGIGGTADYAALLAKKALLEKITKPKGKLEADLLREINKLKIGPMGMGGKTTCLGVNIKTHPTHIAGLPVAINISCHALRSAAKTL